MLAGMLYFAFKMRSFAESSYGCSLKHNTNKIHPNAYNRINN